MRVTVKKKAPPSTSPSSSAKRQSQIRMDDDLKGRIATYQHKLHKDTGIEVSFASAVRSLIERGLEAAKLEAAR
jgi:hypothetical protein